MKKATTQRLLALFAAPVVAATTLISGVQAKGIDTSFSQMENKQTDPFYQQARADIEGSLGRIGEDYYAAYRIVERIARANVLDEQPWRVRITTEDNVNAYASNLNMLTFEGGILEQLHGDTAALACVVGHEMAHHKQRHQVVTNVEKAEFITQIREEAINKVLNRKRKTSPVAAIGDFVVRRVIGGTIGTVVGGVLDNRSSRRFRKQQRRINEIVEEKTAELEENIVKQNRKDEFEADKIAYLASVKAGFDKQGCLRAMSVLNRTTGVKFDQNHPTIEERVAALKAVMEKNKDENLVEEGKENLFQTQPLTYNLSTNQTSLRVNSRHGASVGDDIDRMFGG